MMLPKLSNRKRPLLLDLDFEITFYFTRPGTFEINIILIFDYCTNIALVLWKHRNYVEPLIFNIKQRYVEKI